MSDDEKKIWTAVNSTLFEKEVISDWIQDGTLFGSVLKAEW